MWHNNCSNHILFTKRIAGEIKMVVLSLEVDDKQKKFLWKSFKASERQIEITHLKDNYETCAESAECEIETTPRWLLVNRMSVLNFAKSRPDKSFSNHLTSFVDWLTRAIYYFSFSLTNIFQSWNENIQKIWNTRRATLSPSLEWKNKFTNAHEWNR